MQGVKPGLIFTSSVLPFIFSSSPSAFVPHLYRRKTFSLHRNMSTSVSYCDIGANLLDGRYRGEYRGQQRHQDDIHEVMKRAQEVGVNRIILTAGTLQESREAVQQARRWNKEYPGIHFTCTVGVHPTRCEQEFVKSEKSADEVVQELVEIATDGIKDATVVAIGEIGLDYDRLQFSPKEIQIKYFERQLVDLASKFDLPLFLHDRNVGTDLLEILNKHRNCWKAGVVHSYTGEIHLAKQFIENGLYIGLNGCSLRTTESLEVCRQIPLDRILLETDCPYCDVRKSHPGFEHVKTTWPSRAEKKFVMGETVKSRTEPCHIVQVAEIIAACHKVPLERAATECSQSTDSLFFADK